MQNEDLKKLAHDAIARAYALEALLAAVIKTVPLSQKETLAAAYSQNVQQLTSALLESDTHSELLMATRFHQSRLWHDMGLGAPSDYPK